MENLIFSLNATVPVFLMMILGLVFKKIGWIDDVFASKMNKFVFLVPLPVLVFEDLATVDFSKVWDIRFVLFCFIVTLISITISFVISCLLGDQSIRGEFVQAAYRSSAALLGIAFIQNIYGNAGMAPLMIIGSVPLYNMMAVIVLSVFKPGQNGLDRAVIKKTLKGIVTNPILIGIVAGLLWSALKIPMPAIPKKVISSIGNVATPMGLMAMGATFDIKKAFAKIKPSAIQLLSNWLAFVPYSFQLPFILDSVQISLLQSLLCLALQQLSVVSLWRKTWDMKVLFHPVLLC